MNRYAKVLHELRDGNTSPSEVAVIDRMLEKEVMLVKVYAELNVLDFFQTRIMLSAIVDAGAHWSPEKIKKMREADTRVLELTGEIAKKAKELTRLIEARQRLSEEHGIIADIGISTDEVKSVLDALSVNVICKHVVNVTEAACDVRQSSIRNFIRAAVLRIGNSAKHLPAGFKLTNESLSTVLSVASGVDISTGNVKRTLQEL